MRTLPLQEAKTTLSALAEGAAKAKLPSSPVTDSPHRSCRPRTGPAFIRFGRLLAAPEPEEGAAPSHDTSPVHDAGIDRSPEP